MSTLILYDTTSQWGWLGELYGMMAANLASHFGAWTAQSVVSYTAGLLENYTATIYVGSTYDEPLPLAFLDDVLKTTKPVIWIYDNIWQLTARSSNFANTYGWMWTGFDFSTVGAVDYKGQRLVRYAANNAGIMNYSSPLGASVTTLANAVRSDNTTFPWAIRSKNLTYIGENPFVYIAEGDRYLAFTDLLFDALAPTTPTKHRALLRLEDIDPNFDVNSLRAVADYLYSQQVPFGFQVIPYLTDPLGEYNNGVPRTIHLKDKPAIISAFKYLQSKGGVMINHGYSHQYSNQKNPYTACSGDDAEFFRVTMNSDFSLNYVGPIPGDSTAWAQSRIDASKAEFVAAGFPLPSIWTFPSYLASAADIAVIGRNFTARAERSLYYSGLLKGTTIDPTRYVGQYFPYVVRDVYNTKVLPDNLGGISPDQYFGYPPRLPAAIIADAQRSLVVRDGFASFFFNPGDNISLLQQTVQGVKALGYQFVSPSSL
jgi:YD repeat-containing protein